MKLEGLARHTSGAAATSCHFVMFRYDAQRGLHKDSCDSWVVQREGTTLHCLLGGTSWWTGLWRSPTGKVFMTEASGRLLMNPDPEPRKAPWQELPLSGVVLSGVWGLDDQHVYIWGQPHDHAAGDTVMFFHDGDKLTPMPAPVGKVWSIHGVRPDLVYAVGDGGLIARWDGRAWHTVPAPTQAVLSAVCVVSEDEMYAVGAGKRLLSGSLAGWRDVLEAPSQMFGVAKFQGNVWVGASASGLMKLDGSRLVQSQKMQAERVEARQEILVSSPGGIAGSSDGHKFGGVSISTLLALVADEPPRWVRGG